MKITEKQFRGRAPRVAAQLLPPGYAQIAQNTRLLSGDLEAWGGLRTDTVLSNRVTPINTLFKLRDKFLTWADSDLGAGQTNVDVALGPIAGDTTSRFYFTGTDAPRVSNYALATDEANRGSKLVGQYPYKSYKMGVPPPVTAPSATTEFTEYVEVDYTVEIDGSSLAGLTTSEEILAHPNIQSVLAAGSDGQLPPGQTIGMSGSTGDSTTFMPMPYLAKAGVFDDAIYEKFAVDLYFKDSHSNPAIYFQCHFACDTNGVGPSILLLSNNDSPTDSALVLAVGDSPGWALTGGVQSSGSSASTVPGAYINTALSLEVTMRRDVTGSGYSIDAIVTELAGGTVVVSVTGARATATGGNFGVSEPAADYAYADIPALLFNNVRHFSAGGEATLEETRYVYTWVNFQGEEGPPSPVSALLQHTTDADFETIVNGILDPTGIQITDYGLINGATSVLPGGKNLYRAVTGNAGAEFELVNTEGYIPYGSTTYVDEKQDADLGEALSSSNFDLPPDDMAGILALPNGITVGFSGNTIVPSVQNQPHAYPQSYRLATDSPIKAIAAIDANIVVLTESFPYVVTGDDPASLSMTKLELAQGCVSKRSVVYLQGLGVVYASEDGLWSIRGVGLMQNVTSKLFARREWKELVPSTLISASHDDRYFGFFDSVSLGLAGMIIDDEDFGLTDLTIHAHALFVDLEDDQLYMILDSIESPTDGGTLIPDYTDDQEVLIWDPDEDATTHLRYNWKSRRYDLPMPTTLKICRVKARDYSDIEIGLIADGVEFLTKTITNGREFVIPVVVADEFEVRITGSSRVTQLEVAEHVEELT